MNLDAIEITIDVTQPPPGKFLWWVRFGLGLAWDAFHPMVINCLYSSWLAVYKCVHGAESSWNLIFASAMLGIIVLYAHAWFRRKSGKDDLTPRQRWVAVSRLMVVAYEHGIEVDEVRPWLRGIRLVAARSGRFSYKHFKEWHRTSVVCWFGLRSALSDLVDRIGVEATERAIRRNGSLLLALAKAARD
jgi:hypothetical protein